MTTVGIEVFADPAALATGRCRKIAATWRSSGTPSLIGLGRRQIACRHLSEHARDLPHWDRVDVWLADERWVPHDHEDSNGRMAAEALFDHVNADLPPTAAGRPGSSRTSRPLHYEAVLRSIHPVDHPPDLVLLGLGDDGHTASLFPGTDALKAERRWFVSNFVAALDTWRLTATIPFLTRPVRSTSWSKETTRPIVAEGWPEWITRPCRCSESGRGHVAARRSGRPLVRALRRPPSVLVLRS